MKLLPFGLLFAAGAMAACGIPLGQSGIPQGCADRFVHALASPSAPVPGAFACLDSDLQNAARASTISSDADLQQLAQQDPSYNRYAYVGRTADGAFVYDMSNGKADQVVVVYVDKDGRVKGLMFAQ